MLQGYKPKFILLLTALALAASGVLAGLVTAEDGQPSPEEVQLFGEALSQIKKHYVDETDASDLTFNALRKMFETLDPHSTYLPAYALKDVRQVNKGEFEGLGLKITATDGQVIVCEPIEGTPAERAGIKAEDRIIAIDGAPAGEMRFSDVLARLRGAKGTTVRLTIARDGLAEPFEVVVVRDNIKPRSVHYRLIGGNIGYARIVNLQAKTADDLEAALLKLEEEKIDALVLDLRNNPGGLLNAAVDVAGKFMNAGDIVVTIKGRDNHTKEFQVKTATAHQGYPLVILVNEKTASAAEILTGALQDSGRALVVGTPSFGKGSVQSLIPLGDGSAVKLTTGRYYTPKGRSIQNIGITPDIVVKQPVEMADVDDDVQLQKAIELIKSWKVFRKAALN